MVLVIDNYDSFTYNLVQVVETIVQPWGEDVLVRRNDAISLQELRELRPDRILISPGPGRPERAGVTMPVIRELGSFIPMLGVCLGHQAIAAAFGATIVRASSLMHGKTSSVRHNGIGIFRNLHNPFRAMRYHSLVVEPDSLPEEFEVTAWTDDGVVMGLRHRTLPLVGVQFHPESILTEDGEALLRNWLGMQDSR